VTSRRAQKRRAQKRALDAPAAEEANRAYAVKGRCRWQPRPREDHTPTNKVNQASIHRPGSGGRDRRTAQEFADDLERETEASLRRDPKRWTEKRSNEIPKDRSTEPEAPQ
jgi:hypothetical protein